MLLRSFRASTRFTLKHTPVRGTATYEYRTSGDPDGPNYHLIQHLTQEMQKEEVAPNSNPYKVRALATAIKSIHELDFPIQKSTELKKIPGVGEGIARRIIEFLGVTRKKDYRALSTEDQLQLRKSRVIQELQRVNGIGPIKARALVENGCTSLQQLHEERHFNTLPKAVQTSLVHLKDIESQVTRQHSETFMTSLHEILSPEFKAYLAGSYRRGHRFSSDIDILLIHPSYTTVPLPHVAGFNHASNPSDGTSSQTSHRQTHARPPPTLLQDAVIDPLTRKGIIVSALSSGSSKWQGVVKLQLENEEACRRLDINLMPQPSEAAALLAFTGDAEFNQVCRRRAKRNDMHLNEFGLWRPKLHDDSPIDPATKSADVEWAKSPVQKKGTGFGRREEVQWEFVETPDEAALLWELGMGYIIPERRNFQNINRDSKAEFKKMSGKQRQRGINGSQFRTQQSKAKRPVQR